MPIATDPVCGLRSERACCFGMRWLIMMATGFSNCLLRPLSWAQKFRTPSWNRNCRGDILPSGPPIRRCVQAVRRLRPYRFSHRCQADSGWSTPAVDTEPTAMNSSTCCSVMACPAFQSTLNRQQANQPMRALRRWARACLHNPQHRVSIHRNWRSACRDRWLRGASAASRQQTVSSSLSAVAVIWQPARIVSVGQQKMTLLSSASSPECARCARGEGCGAGVFSRLLVYGNTRLVLPVQPGLQPGDRVSVGVERRRLALAAVLRYGLPLIVFLVFAAAGHILADMSPGRDAAALLAGD